MKILDLYRVWEIMNKLSFEETKLSEEQDKYDTKRGISTRYLE